MFIFVILLRNEIDAEFIDYFVLFVNNKIVRIEVKH
jgi:hypothetical protein